MNTEKDSQEEGVREESEDLSSCCNAPCDELANCTKCGKFRWLNLDSVKNGKVVIPAGESRMFSADSFTLEQDGDDLIATPSTEEHPQDEVLRREEKPSPTNSQEEGVREEWEKEFINRFCYGKTVDGVFIIDTRDKEKINFIRTEKQKSYERGRAEERGRVREWAVEHSTYLYEHSGEEGLAVSGEGVFTDDLLTDLGEEVISSNEKTK